MVRIGFGVVFSISLLSSGLFAGPNDGNLLVDKENAGVPVVMPKLPLPSFPDPYLSQSATQGDESDGSQPLITSKRKVSEIHGQESDDEFSQRAKRVAVSPTALRTPMGAVKKRFRPVRTRVAISLESILNSESGQCESMPLIDSPRKLKAVYQQEFPSNHFTHTGTFEGVPYYLDLRLFNPEQLVMKMSEVSLKLETNLERMQRGCAPFSYKVKPIVEQYIKEPIMVGNPDYYWGINYVQDLYQQQMEHRLDIHHLAKTMDDGVTPLPSGFHHGTDFGVVVKDGEILAYGVSKKEARRFLKEGAKYYGDCLHPNFGKSKIDRKAFGKWRKGFWKYVANLIIQEKENGTYSPFSKLVPEIPIFSVRSSQVAEF